MILKLRSLSVALWYKYAFIDYYMEITIPFLSDSMDELQQWITILFYFLIIVVVYIVFSTLYKILSCGVCLVKCLTCPCRTCCGATYHREDTLERRPLNPPVTIDTV